MSDIKDGLREEHAFRFRNLIETRYFDTRGSGWKFIESRKQWNYFSIFSPSPPLPQTMKRKKSNRSLLFVGHRTRSIEFEAYRAKRT